MRAIVTKDLIAGAAAELGDEPGIGHNQPPPVEVARERIERLIGAADKWTSLKDGLTEEAQARGINDALDQLEQEIKKIDRERRAEKKVYDDLAAAVQQKWRPLDEKLQICKAALKGLLSGWLRREQARLDEERRKKERDAAEARHIADEARRKAEESAAAAGVVTLSVQKAEADELQRQADRAKAIAAEPVRAQARGDLGGRARSLRTYWHARIEDWNKAIRFYRDNPAVREVVQKLANAEAKSSSGKCVIPGCAIYDTQE